jgi:hypothetical protein
LDVVKMPPHNEFEKPPRHLPLSGREFHPPIELRRGGTGRG